MANESEEVGATRTTKLERVAASVGASRPLVSPDSFSCPSSWAEWIDHFEAVALVNGWDNKKSGCAWWPCSATYRESADSVKATYLGHQR